MNPRVFRDVPHAGVGYVMAEAAKLGFTNGAAGWCNFGQGQPEVGPIDGAPKRIETCQWTQSDQAYGPAAGIAALRQAVADHYNRLYRGGHHSKYHAENVAIAAGGRLSLARLFAALGPVRLGYRTPEYAGYEEMLASHAHRLTPVRVTTRSEDGYTLCGSRFAATLAEHRLDAFLLSNPCNPTGQLLDAATMRGYLAAARHHSSVLLLDEFYSQFIYNADGSAADQPVSAARVIDDVEADPVLLIDGLTKGFRYPGWRLSWTVGPARIIEQITRVASAIDGGPATTVQRAALDVLEPAYADQETYAVRATFARKRTLMLHGLASIGIKVPHPPRGAFYVWGDIGALPDSLRDADAFFEAALRQRVVTVPGRCFDVNPAGAREPEADYRRWVRFSFGPSADNLQLGLARLRELVQSHS
jgi:aspartate/methionine/tyrosine aminotransferase